MSGQPPPNYAGGGGYFRMFGFLYSTSPAANYHKR